MEKPPLRIDLSIPHTLLPYKAPAYTKSVWPSISPCNGQFRLCGVLHPCYGPMHKRLERSSAIDCDTSERDDSVQGFRTQENPNVIRRTDRQEAMRDSGVGSDTEPALHPLSDERIPANTSTDTLSITASSAILSPAMMPKVIHTKATADESSDCDSMGSSSAFSVEADEMIGMQSHAWRDPFRDVWHKARWIRGMRGQKTRGSSKYRSIS